MPRWTDHGKVHVRTGYRPPGQMADGQRNHPRQGQQQTEYERRERKLPTIPAHVANVVAGIDERLTKPSAADRHGQEQGG